MNPLTVIILVLVIWLISRLVREAEKQQRAEEDEEQHQDLLDKYGRLSIEEILFNKEIDELDKLTLLEEVHGYETEEAEELLDKQIHPSIVVSGYKKLEKKCDELLEQVAARIDREDVETMKKAVMTSLNSKSVSGIKEYFAPVPIGDLKEFIFIVQGIIRHYDRIFFKLPAQAFDTLNTLCG